MADLVQWLQANNLNNPHAVPETLQDEFDALFGDTVINWPQPGGQIAFSECRADLLIYGGEAGGGKSNCLVREALKWTDRKDFSGALIRKSYKNIFDSDGLWWEAMDQYYPLGGRPKKSENPHYIFPSGAQVFFKHSLHAADVVKNFQGMAASYIGIDELTQFSKREFFYIIGRNRNSGAIRSYVRCGCNPDPDSWVKEIIKWWIDEDGYIIDERCGVVRYWVMEDDEFYTASTIEEIREKFPFRKDNEIKTMTFIRGRLSENKKVSEEYIGTMANQTAADKKALRDGNWNHYDRPDALFTHSNFNKYRIAPEDVPDLKKIVIGIDPAGSTSKNSDDTGIVAAGTDGKECYVLDDKTGKYHPNDWAKASVDLYDELEADYLVAESNYGGEMVQNTIDMYCKSIGRSDVKVKLVRASRGKFVRAEPVATLYTNGKVHHVGHSKLKRLESESASFVEGQEKSPNRMDAKVWAITELAVKSPGKVFRIG